MNKTIREFCEEIIGDLGRVQVHYYDIVESVHDFRKSMNHRLSDADDEGVLIMCLMDGIDAINTALWDDEVIKTSLMDKITAYLESAEMK